MFGTDTLAFFSTKLHYFIRHLFGTRFLALGTLFGREQQTWWEVERKPISREETGASVRRRRRCAARDAALGARGVARRRRGLLAAARQVRLSGFACTTGGENISEVWNV